MSSNNTRTGGSAFPDGSTNDWGNATSPGLTVRDYFAAKAMHAMITSPHASPRDAGSETNCAILAYSYADAMLDVRNAAITPPLKHPRKSWF